LPFSIAGSVAEILKPSGGTINTLVPGILTCVANLVVLISFGKLLLVVWLHEASVKQQNIVIKIFVMEKNVGLNCHQRSGLSAVLVFRDSSARTAAE